MLTGLTLTAVRGRISGLAAEVAFWITFTLPWLLLGVLASLGAIGGALGVDTINATRERLLHLAEAVLPAAAVNDFVKPFLDALLSGGRTDLTVIGFLVAFWSGSRTVLSLVTGVTLISGQGDRRGYVRLRGLVLGIYGVFLLGIVIVVPLSVLGPEWVSQTLSLSPLWTSVGYWSVIVVAILMMLRALYHWSVPVRTGLVHDFPGALLALIAWVVGSIGLRFYLARLFHNGSVYSVAAAPIAILLWVYVTGFSVLMGAALNAVLSGSGEGPRGGRHVAATTLGDETALY